MGWEGVEAVKRYSNFGTRARYYRLGNVRCTGSELSILDCPHSEHMDQGSLGSYAAGVVCTKDPQGTNVTLQSVKNNTKSGLVYVNGSPVCEDKWDMADANVTCQQMGFNHVQHIIGKSFGGSVQLPYSMMEVECVGNETLLSDCIHLHANESNNCKDGNAAGVECSNITKGNFVD